MQNGINNKGKIDDPVIASFALYSLVKAFDKPLKNKLWLFIDDKICNTY